MKKLIALLLILVMTLSFCACSDTEDEATAGENGQNAQGNAEATGDAADSTEPFDITTLSNYYQDLSEPQVVEGKVNYQIFQAWFEDSCLIMDIYFINGHDEPAYNFWFDEIEIYNGDKEVDGEVVIGGLISSANVGPVEIKEPIPGGAYQIVRLYLPADLEGYLDSLTMQVKDSYDWGYAEAPAEETTAAPETTAAG